MTAIARLRTALFDPMDHRDWLLPTLARAVFFFVFFFYFNQSLSTKIETISIPLVLATLHIPVSVIPDATSAFVQMFPKAFDAAGYDASAMSAFHWLVAVLGTWAEFLLPLMLVLGLLTRLAALGMLGFVAVQTLVDVTGHSVPFGSWLNNSLELLDERTLWVFLLLVLVVKGAGPYSVDRLFTSKTA